MFFKKKNVLNNGIKNLINTPYLKKFKIIVNGNKNVIQIDSKIEHLKGVLSIYGDNNTITIKKGYQMNLSIDIGCNNNKRASHCNVNIGKDLYCGKTHVFLGEDNSTIIIGDDCMFSENIEIYCSDGHSILDKTNQIINTGKNVIIGDHVWIGMDTKIGKNVKISNNSVIGWNSVVTKKFDQENCIIAGNPAKIVKSNISWTRESPNQLLEKKSV